MEKTMRTGLWPWLFEEKEAFLDRQSEAGWQLKKAGHAACRFQRDTDVRWRYRMAILPPDADAVIAAYAKQRWELCGTSGRWSFFRKPYDEKLPEASYRLPDDTAEDRVESYFRKLMRLCVTIITICCVIAAGFAVYAYIRKVHLWQVAMPFAVVVILCAYPYIKLEGWLESKGRLKPEQKKR